jgi:predicted unusual protein kinase regulating ubiquinone biosynthesis (AarF/ABC1/UbiB family)
MPRLRDRLVEQMRRQSGQVPSGALGRLPRFGMLALRGGKLGLGEALRKEADKGQLNEETLSRLVMSVGELKGVTMKLGQMLSYVDVALPEDARDALAALQEHSRPIGIGDVYEVLRRDLKAAADPLIRTLSSEPLASASIAQVHRAVLDDGTPVAVKVQYPTVATVIRRDFEPAAFGSGLISFIYGGGGAGRFVGEARERFLRECDFTHEAQMQERFRALYADDDTIVIPEVHAPWSSERVLTMTFIEGEDLEAFLARDPDQQTRDRVGTALFRFYLGTLFTDGLFNCDPHPGNLRFLPDGRVAILDHGCTHALDDRFLTKLAALTQAVHADDEEQLHEALLALEIVGPATRYDRPRMRELMRSFYGPMLRDDDVVFRDGDGLKMRGITSRGDLLRGGLPGEFLFLLRVRIGLASVLARIGTRANWYRLERDVVAQHFERMADEADPRAWHVVIQRPGDDRLTLLRALYDHDPEVGVAGFERLLEVLPARLPRVLRHAEADALLARVVAAGAEGRIASVEEPAAGAVAGVDAPRPTRRRRRARRSWR